jgi:hypothetical protein
MSILSDFNALADPIFSGRVYRNNAGDSPIAPYAVFFRVAGVEGVTLDENGGTDNETETRIQLDIYAAGGTELDDLVDTMKAALKSWTVSNIILLEMDGWEPENKLNRITLDIATIA